MNDSFLRACRRQPVERTPVWYMRQAGRYQPEYRKLRERHGMLEICRTPVLAARVTKLPVEQLGVDAAILFSDIMVPLVALGADVRIEEGVGPVVGEVPDPARLGPAVAVQGNLDPAALLGPWDVVEGKALHILAQAGRRPGHVFNLGHGVLPETDPDVLRKLTALVHERSVVAEGAVP